MGVNLQDLLTKEYGVRTTLRINPLIDSVGVTVAQILGNNPSRLGWAIFNLSANGLYVLPERNVSATHGMYIAPNGGYMGWVWNEEWQAVCWAQWAIATGANSDVLVLEFNAA